MLVDIVKISFSFTIHLNRYDWELRGNTSPVSVAAQQQTQSAVIRLQNLC